MITVNHLELTEFVVKYYYYKIKYRNLKKENKKQIEMTSIIKEDTKPKANKNLEISK